MAFKFMYLGLCKLLLQNKNGPISYFERVCLNVKYL